MKYKIIKKYNDIWLILYEYNNKYFIVNSSNDLKLVNGTKHSGYSSEIEALFDFKEVISRSDFSKKSTSKFSH